MASGPQLPWGGRLRSEWLERGILVVRDATLRCDEIIRWAEQKGMWLGSTESLLDGQHAATTNRTSSSVGLTKLKQDDEVATELDAHVFDVVARHLAEYRATHQFLTVRGDSGYDVLRYGVGERYTVHVDDGMTTSRRLSALLYLNDDYEGGELNLPAHGIRIKPERGMLVMFPSCFLYPHESIPITRGTKYVIVTWVT
jgi:predicted 2-oxoglutarate/Fe(II)-dependent dioxygenase YbiX